MPLDLPIGNEEYAPIIKFNAKAGRWYIRGDDGVDHEQTQPRFAMDMARIKTGWISFPQSGPPAFHWDVNGDQLPKPPADSGERWKRGFKVLVYGPDPVECLGGNPMGLREWIANSLAANRGISAAYKQFEEAKAGNQVNGSCPVFRTNGIKVEHGPNGDSYEPVFELEKWVERNKLPGLDAPEPAAPKRVVVPLDDEVPF